MTRALTVAALLTCSAVLSLGGQDRPAADRRRYLDTALTRTTDDPRRTPIAPERQGGPEPVIVTIAPTGCVLLADLGSVSVPASL